MRFSRSSVSSRARRNADLFHADLVSHTAREVAEANLFERDLFGPPRRRNGPVRALGRRRRAPAEVLEWEDFVEDAPKGKLPAATVVVSATPAFELPDTSSKQVSAMMRHTELWEVKEKRKVGSAWWYHVTFDLKGKRTSAWVNAEDLTEIADPPTFSFATSGSDGWFSPFEEVRDAVKSAKIEPKIARHVNYLNIMVLPDSFTLSETVTKAFYHALVEAKGDFKEACLIVTAAVRAQKTATGGVFLWVQQRGPAVKNYNWAGYHDKVWHFFWNAHQRLDGTGAKWLDTKGILYEMKSRPNPVKAFFTLEGPSRDAKEDIVFNRGGIAFANWLMDNRDAVLGAWKDRLSKEIRQKIEGDAQTKTLSEPDKTKLFEQILRHDDSIRWVQKNAWNDFAEAAGGITDNVLAAIAKLS